MVACPRCGSQDAVQKVSSIVSGGTYETTYEVPAQGQLAGHTIYGTVQQRGMAQTALAQKLNIDRSDKAWNTFATERVKQAQKTYQEERPAPKKGCLPQVFSGSGWLTLGLVGLSLPELCGGVTGENLLVWLAAIAIGVLLGVGFLWLARKLTPPERKKWEADLAATRANTPKETAQIRAKTFSRWERLYYCHRDDLVFLPEEHLSAPSSGMMHMLMWE